MGHTKMPRNLYDRLPKAFRRAVEETPQCTCCAASGDGVNAATILSSLTARALMVAEFEDDEPCYDSRGVRIHTAIASFSSFPTGAAMRRQEKLTRDILDWAEKSDAEDGTTLIAAIDAGWAIVELAGLGMPKADEGMVN